MIVGFEPGDESPEARLARAFGVEQAAAAMLVTGLPRTVQRAVSRVRAEYFRRALELIGALCEVRDRDGHTVAREGHASEPATPVPSDGHTWIGSAPLTARAEAIASRGADLPLRAPAHPTQREVRAPVLRASSRPAPAGLSATADASSTPVSAASDLAWPRVPSSVFDPPAPKREVAQAESAALEVQPQWEQPSFESMSEPPPRVSRRPPGAPPVPKPRSLRPGAERAERKPPSHPVKAADASGRPVPRPQPPRTSARPPVRAVRRPASEPEPHSFWESFGEALALPFVGPGVYWIAAITLGSVVVGVLDLLSGLAFGAGRIVMFCAHSALLALACDYYRVCFWTPATGDRTLDRGPELGLTRIFNRYVKSGLHLSVFMIASQIPLIARLMHDVGQQLSAREMLHDPITWLLALLPYGYWPMAVCVAALSNDFAAIWNVPAGARAILRAPLEYAAIVAVGMTAFALGWGLLLLLGSFLGVSGALVSGTIGFPLAVSHGLQGAWMGHLARARPEVFE